MKKLVLTSVCALAMAGAALAQGNLNWSSAAGLNPGFFSVQTNSTLYSPLFGGGSTGGGAVGNTGAFSAGFPSAYYYALLYTGPTTGTGSWSGSQLAGANAPSNSLTALLTFSDSGLMGTNGANHFATTINPNTGASVAWGTATTNNIIIVGWSANIGTAAGGENWGAVSNLLANWSTLGNTVVGNAFFGVSSAGFLATSASVPGASVTGGGASAFGLAINGPNTQLYLLPVPEPGTMALAGLGGLGLLLFRRRK